MISTIKLRTLLGISIAIGVLYLAVAMQQFKSQEAALSHLEQKWSLYRHSQAESQRLISELVEIFGYGGITHQFHNYLLRNESRYRVDILISTGIVRERVNRLRHIMDKGAELSVLNDLETVALDIEKATLLYQKSDHSPSSARHFVELPDFELAQRGLKLLLEMPLPDGATAEHVRSMLLHRIIGLAGINGLIHHFKEYVFFGRDEDYNSFMASYEKFDETLKALLANSSNNTTSLAVNDIRRTFNQYATNLDIVRAEHTKRTPIRQIDALVKINDEYAIRGFKLLDAQNILDLQNEAKQVQGIINRLAPDLRSSYQQKLILLISLIVIGNFIALVFVIRPIEKITDAMHRLSDGDLDATITRKDRVDDSELGRLASAFEEFKIHEIERRQAEGNLRELAMTDSLTRLANRTQLEQRFIELANIARREKNPIAVIYMDLDNFKPINDTYGHLAGDQFLREVATVFSEELRDTDISARMGGDEFVAVLYNPESYEKAKAVAERIKDRIGEIVPAPGSELRATASAGLIHMVPREDENLANLIKAADEALYKAKREGKNTVVHMAR